MDRHRDAVPKSGVVGAGLDMPALYEQHKGAMYRVARTMLRRYDEHRAEDAVQEAMISLWQRPPTDVDNWEAVLVQAVKWKVYDMLKSSVRTHELLLLDEATPLDAEHGPDDLALDPAVVVEEVHERETTAIRIRDALAELARTDPEAARVYCQVKELERTSAEVADEMGVSDSRVRQHVMRARKQLRDILDTKGGGL